MRVFYKTYGCTLSQADAELTQSLLEKEGHESVLAEEEAEIVVVSTCGVKEATENKILHYLQGLERQGKKVVVSGCLPAMNLKKVEKYAPNALGYVGPNSIGKIPGLLQRRDEANGNGRREGNGIGEEGMAEGENGNGFSRVEMGGKFSSKFNVENTGRGVIARLQVSSGCLSACTFCATKLARGAFESKPMERIMEETRRAVAKGAKEIQLCSQDMGCYGFDLKTNVARVVKELNGLEGRFRIRIGMGSPQHMETYAGELAEALQLPKVYKFLHVPVQSGSDEVLQRMKRTYTVEQCRKLIARMREAVPNLMVGTDMIVGFPGETEEQYQESMAFLREMRFDVVNVSKFSKREGTKAAEMKEVSSQVKKQRAEEMSRVALQMAREINRESIGKQFTVLLTEYAKRGFVAGRNDSYKTVLVKPRAHAALELGSFVQAEIADATHAYLLAKE